ncbi:MAG: lysophospholipid acyltransferase family protein [Zetaproteobacteria bacterium]|nr:lysophospholipid acyltransferase family protein [Zetaproteobacteria bacterium]
MVPLAEASVDSKFEAFISNLVKALRGVVFACILLCVTVSCYILLLWGRFYSLISTKKQLSQRSHAVASLWGQLIFKLMPGWDAEISGAEYLKPIREGQARVIVVNHQSNADIMPLYFLDIPFCWLAKDILFKLPMVGQAMRWAGYVAVKRHDKFSREQAVHQCQQLLCSGTSVVFFPEGTRSVDGNIKDFKLGAFRLARE